MTCYKQKLTIWPGKCILSKKETKKTPKIMDNFSDMLKNNIKKLNKSRLSDSFFSVIFGHFRDRAPNLHCKISDFGFLSVSFDFFA